VAIFPAGEVSHLQVAEAKIADPAWNQTAVRLARRTGASVLPIFFCGHHSVGFQILGVFHPRLRTALLLQEFLQQEGKTIEVRVGNDISHQRIAAIKDDREATAYLPGAPICLRIEGGAKAPGPPPYAPGSHSTLSVPSPYRCSRKCCRKNWPSSRRAVA
jgi:putative hemolysin